MYDKYSESSSGITCLRNSEQNKNGAYLVQASLTSVLLMNLAGICHIKKNYSDQVNGSSVP